MKMFRMDSSRMNKRVSINMNIYDKIFNLRCRGGNTERTKEVLRRLSRQKPIKGKTFRYEVLEEE